MAFSKRQKKKKRIDRVTKDRFKYIYAEGAVPFPDPLDRPGRTILTKEPTLNRSTHVVGD